MAEQIKTLVGGAPVKINQIAPGVNVDPDVNSGTRIEQDLKSAIEASGLLVTNDARFTVLGNYSVVPSSAAVSVVRIELDVRDSNGRALANLNAEGQRVLAANVDSVVTLATIAQLSTSLEPLQDGDKNEDVRRAKLEESLTMSTQMLKGNRVRADQDGQYELEILVQPNLQVEPQSVLPRLETIKTKQEAFVTLPEESLYIVRIHNPTTKEVAVSLTIDGLDAFHFSKERDPKNVRQPKYTHYIIAPGTSLDVEGWFLEVKEPNNVSSFQVKQLGGGAIGAEKQKIPGLKVRGPVGVIHASFSLSLPKKPGSERSKQAGETGLGPPRSVKQEAVERDFDPPHEFISVRYKRAN
jgi:hypothetical protein